MKTLTLYCLIIFTCAASAPAQEKSISIPFLEKSPVIDGLPDSSMTALHWRDFTEVEKSDAKNSDVTVRYELGYGYRFLYVLIESNSDSIVRRDRAYQNGDGFHMVIANPDSGKPTGEFYVLRFSPGDASRNIAPQKNEWYYNVGLSWKPLSSKTRFACASRGGKSYFELLLSWDDVYPYHPLFSNGIGLNLCFVEAIGKSEKNYYFLKYDDKIQSELSKREYLYAGFEKPAAAVASMSLAMLDRRNIQERDSGKIKVVSYSKGSSSVVYHFAVSSVDNCLCAGLAKEETETAGLNIHDFSLPVEKLAPGEYNIVWRSSDNSEGAAHLTILPRMNYQKERSVLDRLKGATTTGNYNTLLFMLEDIFTRYRNIKPYETAGAIREGYNSYREYVAKLARGDDSLAHRTGIFRRAFLSGIDTTLQPYTIKIPGNYTRTKRYPLLVMLHGSGEDDQEILRGTDLSGGHFIEAAPYGRGTSNCFTTDGAQADVKEAIDDVIRNYSVDTTKIVIAGFSMGGYGAYRTFYEYPALFRGVAVFSGNPSLATKWIGEGFPDFLVEKYLKPFRNVPVFIYHSRNDLNCPYSLTERLVAKLQKAGAKVEFVTTEAGGHGIIDKANIPKYYDWLDDLIR